MKNSIIAFSVCVIASIGVILYLNGYGKSSHTADETSFGAAMPQRDVSSTANYKSGAVENRSAEKAGPVVPLSDSKQTDLPFEKKLIDGNSLNLAKIETLLKSKTFEIQLDKFTNESVTDSNASELTTAYKERMLAQFQSHDIKANLVKLTCGIETCIGLIRNGVDSEYNRWADIFFADPETPGYGFLNVSVKQDDGNLEHRFIFSTDPGVDSISVPRQ